MDELFLGVDLGGTNVKLGVCTASGEAKGSASIPTHPERGPEDAADRIGAAVEMLLSRAGKAVACGTGVPGPLDLGRRTLLRANNLKGWSKVAWPEILERRLRLPTIMENDSNCAAWGEYVAGAGQGVRGLVLYTLGTGVGGGIVINGELWVGANGAAGEFGHMSLDPKGPLCACGQRGCVEQYASASAVAKRWGRGSARDCFDAAKRGDAEAAAVVDWAADGLAAGVAATIHVLHPELVVLAGGMALAGEFLFSRVREGVWKRVAPGYVEAIRIEPSQIPDDDAGWLGAALWAARR
jgi:glucokinase